MRLEDVCEGSNVCSRKGSPWICRARKYRKDDIDGSPRRECVRASPPDLIYCRLRVRGVVMCGNIFSLPTWLPRARRDIVLLLYQTIKYAEQCFLDNFNTRVLCSLPKVALCCLRILGRIHRFQRILLYCPISRNR